jgi:hypothetical protein
MISSMSKGGVRHELGRKVGSFTTKGVKVSDSQRGAKSIGMERTHTALKFDTSPLEPQIMRECSSILYENPNINSA